MQLPLSTLTPRSALDLFSDIALRAKLLSMIVALASLIALVQLPQSAAVTDQTSDALVVASLLEALRVGDSERAVTLLAPRATFDGQTGSKEDILERLAAYTRSCQLDRIYLVNVRSGSRMPVQAKWQCRYPEPDRHASFWFEDDQIDRIRWGPLPTIQLRTPDME